jgi:peptidoglycan/LPS O-acetylase OafA/YrhL
MERKQGGVSRFVSWLFPRDDSRVPSLDGIRALLVLLIGWFHIWQQGWYSPPLTVLGAKIDLTFLPRTGYLWVDGLLLLSGFLLYLPYAMAKEAGKPLPRALPFYKKRAVRIIPSYYLAILIMLVFVALPENRYASPADMLKDLAAHFTFTHTLFAFSYTGTPLNGALWTLGVEMQFYFIFPLLARAFVKKPAITYLLLAGAAFAYRAYVGQLADTSLYFNQLPAFLDVYANGFIAASVYAALKKRLKEDGWTRLLFTACACVCAAMLMGLAQSQAALWDGEAIRHGQMDRRFILSAVLALMILGCALSSGILRMALSSRIARFLGEISLQFYIWHQVFAVRLKGWRFPPSPFDQPWANDPSWQARYTLCCFAGAIIIAALVTYLFEKPVARVLSGKKQLSGRKPV